MQPASSPNVIDRLLRVSRSQPLASGSISKLNHLLLVADLHPTSQGAIELAVELTEQFNPRLTLMHGGDLRSLAGGQTSSSPEDPDQRRLSLLCLLWHLRQRCPEIGLCSAYGHLATQVLEAAAQRNVDLVVLPADLFGRFLPLVSRNHATERVAGAPCPVVVVEDQRSEDLASEGLNFR
ncbi:MAG: universal stress protein [Verrucomicrobia bacterium]|nr:universal stress protein [Verrucomicrobiota bacterium]